MAHRKVRQLSLADHVVSRGARPNGFLCRLSGLLDWRALGEIVGVLHGSAYGAPAYARLSMVRFCCCSNGTT